MTPLTGSVWGAALGAALGAGGSYVLGNRKGKTLALAGGGGAALGGVVGMVVGKHYAALPASGSSTGSTGTSTGSTGTSGAPSSVTLALFPDTQNPAQQTSIAVGGTLTVTPPQSGTWALSPSSPWPPASGWNWVSSTVPPGIEITANPTAAGQTTIQYVETDANGNQLSPPVTATLIVTAS